MTDAVKSVSESFNRYWLRYGPSIVGTILTAVYWAHYSPSHKLLKESVDGIFKNGVSATSAIAAVIIATGLGYVFTWPLLILHAFRFPGARQKALADRRGQALHHKDGPTKDVEFIETVRHMREHGNSLACFGFTILQLTLLLWWVLGSDPSMPVSILGICLLSILPITCGLWVWFQARRLETLQLG